MPAGRALAARQTERGAAPPPLHATHPAHPACCRRNSLCPQSAVVDLRHAANTEAAAAEGRLDGALRRLAQALDPAFPPGGSRLQALELLAAVLQVGAAGVGGLQLEIPRWEV